MNTEGFEQLKSSIVQAGRIMSGLQKPSREFTHEIVAELEPMQELWAVCLESDDPALLVPRKLYLVKYGETGVWVRDESGDMTLCDKEDFLPVSFAPEIAKLLSEAS